VVVSGGYEDDRDDGDTIIYTGHGGNDPSTGRQIADQTVTVGNLALARNRAEGLPVRVTRGAGLDSPFAPETGFRYDGLYHVDPAAPPRPDIPAPPMDLSASPWPPGDARAAEMAQGRPTLFARV
jgi:SAD/SRA domain-containing protein